jgi:hypothetical protein
VSEAWGDTEDHLVERRVHAVLSAAERYDTAVRVDRFSELMPEAGPADSGEVREWLRLHPDIGRLTGSRVTAGVDRVPEGIEAREARGARFLEQATAAANGPLAPVRPLVRCLAVTGSAAYGEPSRGDDLDFLVVTRRGAVWTFLLYSYLAGRLRRPTPGPDDASHWCFNYVVDERVARREFLESRGFLFAREALTARPIAGGRYYRGLVGVAPWLAEEVPRLYERWRTDGLPPLPEEEPAPLLVRAANVVLYPLVASYLVLAALVRNRRYRRSGNSDRCFRVEAAPDRLTFETDRFEELRALYAPAGATAGPSARRA